MRRLTFQAPVDEFTSYGITFRNIFLELRKRDIHVSVRPTKIQTPFGTKIRPEIMESIVNGPQPEEWEIIFGPAIHLPTTGKRTFYWTTFESNTIFSESRNLLKRAEAVAVMRRSIRNANPGKVNLWLPIGIDTKLFSPLSKGKTSNRDVTVFGSAGRLAHGVERKGLGKLIERFQSEYTHGENVRLMLKVHPDCPLDAPDDPRIEIIRFHLPEEEIVRWLNSLSVYVHASTFEGFGLWPLQAMACGIRTISLNDIPDYMDTKDVIGVTMAETRMDWISETGYQAQSERVKSASKWSIEKAVDRFISELEARRILPKEPWWKRFRRIHKPDKSSSIRRIIHVVPDFDGDNEKDAARNRVAQCSWPKESRGLVRKLIGERHVQRVFHDDKRDLWFLKDVIGSAIAGMSRSDVVLFSNSDIFIAEHIERIVLSSISRAPGLIFPRIEFESLTNSVPDNEISRGQPCPGFDMFAFTVDWWTDNCHKIPDMLLGAEGWDSVLAEIIGVNNATIVRNVCYHSKHAAHWRVNRFKISSQRYNRSLAKRFFASRNIPSPIDNGTIQEPGSEVSNLI